MSCTEAFAEAHTGLGYRTFYPLLLRSCQTLMVLHNAPLDMVTATLGTVVEEASRRRLPVVRWHHSLYPNQVTGLWLPATATAMVTAAVYQQVRQGPPGAQVQHLDLGGFPETGTTPPAAVRAQHMLANARYCLLEWEAMLDDCGALDRSRLYQWRIRLESEYLKEFQRKRGQDSHLFSTVLTTEGPSSWVKNLADRVSRRVLFIGPNLDLKTSLIRQLGEKALTLGFDVQFYHCGLDPARTDHIIIPELNLGLFNAVAPHLPLVDQEADEVLDFSGLIFWDRVPQRWHELLWHQFQLAYTRAWAILADISPLSREHPPTPPAILRQLLVTLGDHVRSTA